MGSGTVLIVSTDEDLHAEAVACLLERNGVPVVRLSTQHFPRAVGLTMTEGEHGRATLTLPGDRQLADDDIVAVWWRRPSGYSIDDRIEGKAPREFARVNSMHAFEAFLTTLSARVMNDIWMQRRAQRKGLQLRLARQCGLRVPHTIISNEPSSVRRAVSSRPKMIYKALEKISRASDGTKLLETDDLLRLDHLRHAPVIFQEFIRPGFDLRITIVDRDVYAAKLVSEHSFGKVDIRLDMGAHIERFQLPEQIHDALLDLMGRLGLVFGAVDMKVDNAGDYFFLEVNPAGQWIYIEMETGQPITERIAAWLAGRELKPGKVS